MDRGAWATSNIQIKTHFLFSTVLANCNISNETTAKNIQPKCIEMPVGMAGEREANGRQNQCKEKTHWIRIHADKKRFNSLLFLSSVRYGDFCYFVCESVNSTRDSFVFGFWIPGADESQTAQKHAVGGGSPVSACLVRMQNNLVIHSFDCARTICEWTLTPPTAKWIFLSLVYLRHANAAVVDHKFIKLNATKYGDEKKHHTHARKNHFVDVDNVSADSEHTKKKKQKKKMK